ncbi:MAG: FtsQ-type POTRA domain-containing protein [Vicinamibacteria bacterium]|nr:FtsQ-type POTRA domain-containing protein [Vicinamibacteria bacterium]
MAIAAPADRRFRRSHVRPSRRRSPRVTRLLKAVRLVTSVGVLGGAGWYAAQAVTDAQTLRVSEIHVRGNQHLARGDVLALLAGLEGQHLLQADLEVWRRRVLGSPWVEQAALRRVLPSTVEVVIRERTPIAIGRIRGDLYLVDEQGLVIDEYGPNYAQFDLPIIDGLADTAAAGEPNVDPERAGLAADLLRALEGQPALMKRISQIDVASAHDAVVLLDQDPALVHVGDEQFVERLQRYLELHQALHSRVPDIEYVDLRFDDRVYVRPARTAAALRASGVR